MIVGIEDMWSGLWKAHTAVNYDGRKEISVGTGQGVLKCRYDGHM